RRLCPNVSAEIPVPSETKKTGRRACTMRKRRDSVATPVKYRLPERAATQGGHHMAASEYIVRFEDLRMTDVGHVGGKNASLGEMIGNLAGRGIRVPGGFATTAAAYREFLGAAGLAQRIDAELARLDPNDVDALA